MSFTKTYNNIAKSLKIPFLVSLSQSLTQFLIRIWVGYIFFKAGQTKLSNWDQTLFLFEYEYAVPLLPVTLAAFLAVAIELIFPIFLALGLFSRLAVLPILIMTIIIELFIIQNSEHLYWIALMLGILSFGSGKISLDNLVAKKSKLTRI